MYLFFFFFFFQAEDGIRDKLVTGVQTCALPISGGADLALGVREPEEAERLQRSCRRDRRAVFERRTRNRQQEVDRQRVDAELAQRERELDDVVVGLAHAQDAAAARRETGALYGAHGRDAIGVGVRRAD